MSLVTRTFTLKPGRILMVGWIGEVLLGDRLAGLVDCAAGVRSPELRHRRVVARDVALAALGGRGHERAESDAGDDSPPVVVHLVGEAGVAGEVDAGHAFERDGAAVGSDQPVPADEDALLPEGDSRVVGGEQARALRDEQVVARDGVVDVLADLADDLPGRSLFIPVMRLVGMIVPALTS